MELVKTKKEAKAEYDREYRKENKEAIAEKKLEYDKANKEELAVKRQAANLMKKFGITKAEYNDMLYNQKGGCACCGRHHTEFKKALAVDHDHDTGDNRALLCSNCNTALGLVGESVEGAKKLYEYALNYVKAS